LTVEKTNGLTLPR